MRYSIAPAFAALLAFAAPAMAQDMTTSWTGLYLGVNAGYGFGGNTVFTTGQTAVNNAPVSDGARRFGTGQIFHDEHGRLFRDHGDAVPARLARRDRVVTRLLQVIVWEFVVGDLQLLQASHVRLSLREPLRETLPTSPNAVHVPSRDDHGPSSSTN